VTKLLSASSVAFFPPQRSYLFESSTSLPLRVASSCGNLKDLAMRAAKEEQTLRGWRKNAAGAGEHL